MRTSDGNIPEPLDDFDALLQHLLDSRLTVDEQRCLVELIMHDPQRHKDLMLGLMVHTTLQREGTRLSGHEFLESLGLSVRPYGDGKSRSGCAKVQGAPLNVLVSFLKTPGEFLAKLAGCARQHDRRDWSASRFFGAAACLALVMATFGVWRLLPREKHTPVTFRAGSEKAGEFMGKLPVITSLISKDGITSLQIANVGTVTLDGQSDFRLIGEKRAGLSYGRLRMHVTEESGHGFVIETPDGNVTDLGTEFGLDVASGMKSGLVVFDGSVDLQVADSNGLVHDEKERLLCGEGVVFRKGEAIDRINSIVTKKTSFLRTTDTCLADTAPVITNIFDNLPVNETKRFYEIVRSGFQEDVVAFVDRPGYQWNGATTKGIPDFLVGADYVKTFNDDRWIRGLVLTVEISRPAMLYVLYGYRAEPPKWLTESFTDTIRIWWQIVDTRNRNRQCGGTIREYSTSAQEYN